MLKFRLPCVICVFSVLVLQILPFGIGLSLNMGNSGITTATFSYFDPTLFSHGITTALPSALLTSLGVLVVSIQLFVNMTYLEKFIPIILGLAFLLTLFVFLRHSLGIISLIISILLFIAFVLSIFPFIIETRKKYKNQ